MEGKYLMPDEYDIYLEGLRRSGVTNMYGAIPCVQMTSLIMIIGFFKKGDKND